MGEEVPAQITGYMTMKKLTPLRRVENIQEAAAALSTYSGPNTMVKAGTQYVQKMNVNMNKPVNPYYPQPQQQLVMVVPAQPQQAVINQMQQPLAPSYNPAAVAINPTAPSTPY